MIVPYRSADTETYILKLLYKLDFEISDFERKYINLLSMLLRHSHIHLNIRGQYFPLDDFINVK